MHLNIYKDKKIGKKEKAKKNKKIFFVHHR
jgi:hypothetical protein